jgi:hypothetical protein
VFSEIQLRERAVLKGRGSCFGVEESVGTENRNHGVKSGKHPLEMPRDFGLALKNPE